MLNTLDPKSIVLVILLISSVQALFTEDATSITFPNIFLRLFLISPKPFNNPSEYPFAHHIPIVANSIDGELTPKVFLAAIMEVLAIFSVAFLTFEEYSPIPLINPSGTELPIHLNTFDGELILNMFLADS